MSDIYFGGERLGASEVVEVNPENESVRAQLREKYLEENVVLELNPHLGKAEWVEAITIG